MPLPSSIGAVTLRPVHGADREFLRRLYASTREDELRVVPWTSEQKDAFLRQQFDAQDAHYRQHYPGASLDVIVRDGAPAGRLYVARWPGEVRVMDIALLPEHRGSGIGSALLAELFAEADADGRRVSIHVESYNPARRLYERLGFRPAGEHGVYLRMERPPSAAGTA